MTVERTRNHRILTSAILLLVMLSALYSQPREGRGDLYFLARQYYEQQDYLRALSFFQMALIENPALAKRFPDVQFKLAYCYYQIGQFQDAITHFARADSLNRDLGDYANYFLARATLARGDTNSALTRLTTFHQEFPASTLGEAVDSLLGDIYFRRRSWNTAAGYYRKLMKYGNMDRGEVGGRLVEIYKRLGQAAALEAQAFDLMRKYPFHPQSPGAYREISHRYRNVPLPAEKLERVFNYLAQTGQFRELEQVLAAQEKRQGDTEQLRWLKIRKLYEEKKYWASFQSSQKLRDSFTVARYRRNVDLNIARCYLRMGLKDKAIAAYDTFQKRYPRDGLSAEVLWVIAWLSEEQGRALDARAYYQRLVQLYPRYELANEARFRMGLSYYREGDYPAARQQWESLLSRRLDEMWNARLHFWVAKTYQQEGNDSLYTRHLQSIVDEPFENYYRMKAFLITKNRGEIRRFVDSLLLEVNQKPLTYLPTYLPHFQKPLRVQEIFGEAYALRELNQLARTLKKPGWELAFALGEMNEKLKNYGRAYRYYQKVYLENFAKSNWREWIFLFKHLYPLYFNGEVNEYARKWNITPASIWAVMKQESAFESQITSYAHAYGLMQIIPPTADRLSESLGVKFNDVRRLFEPEFNIQLGSFYLSELLRRYDGNLYHALAAYNAGEHRVDRWRKVFDTRDDDFFMENIEFEQTRKYVRAVMKYYWMYHLLIHPTDGSEELADFPAKTARNPWFRQTEAYR